MLKFYYVILTAVLSGVFINGQSQEYNLLPDSVFTHPFYDFCTENLSWGSQCSNWYSLYCRDSCCVLTFEYHVKTDNDTILIGNQKMFILDVATGKKYYAKKALHGAMLNNYNIAKGYKGEHAFFQIVYDRLPKSTKTVKLYGLNILGINGFQDFDLAALKPLDINIKEEDRFTWHDPLDVYDDEFPRLRKPVLKNPDVKYDENDSTTYPVFTDLPKVYPLTTDELRENRVAVWCKQDTTLVTFVLECTKHRTKCCLDFSSQFYIDALNGKDAIKLIRLVEPYPNTKNFIIEAEPGDFVVIEMCCKAIPLGINEMRADIELNRKMKYDNPFESNNYSPTQFFGSHTIGFFRENQKCIRLLPN